MIQKTSAKQAGCPRAVGGENTPAAGHRQSLGRGEQRGSGATGLGAGRHACSGNVREHYGNFHKLSLTSQGSKIPATLDKNGLQTCEFPANAQISSKIKLSNLLETFPKRYSWKNNNKRQCRIHSRVCGRLTHSRTEGGLHMGPSARSSGRT